MAMASRTLDEPFVAFSAAHVACIAQFKPAAAYSSHTAGDEFIADRRSLAMRSYRWASLLALAVHLLGIAPAGATSGQANVPRAPLDAIWRIQEFDLRFRTAQHYHSCSSLHQKISGILEAVGAGKVVVKLSCSKDELTNHAYARVATAAPVDASPQNIEAATTFDSRQVLVARLREVQLPTANDIERFPAEWRTVSLTRVAALRLGPGDCELLRGLNEQVFPHLSIRVVRKQLSCSSPALFNPARPVLVVEALIRRTA
jgi:hypothetical protein